jgi:hypothetical protein
MTAKEILTSEEFNIYTQNIFDVLTKVADAINTLTTKIISLEEKVQSLSQTSHRNNCFFHVEWNNRN